MNEPRDPFIRDDDGNIVAVKLADDDGQPYSLADAQKANPEEYQRFAETFGDDEDDEE